MTTNNILNIENRNGKLKLNDQVSKESADQLIKDLDQLYGDYAVVSNMSIGEITCSAENALETVDVEINSPGGSVMEGHRIYNALRGISSRGVNVVTTVNGQAASMGSVILMAGDERKMTHGSRIMIHEASMSVRNGDAKLLATCSNLLEGISSEIAGIYAEKSKGTTDEIRQMMKDETWMSADEAETAGFIDTVIKDGADKPSEPEPSNELKSPLFQTHNTNTKEMKNPFTPDAELTAKLEIANTENTELTAKISEYEEVMKTDAENITSMQAEKTELVSKLETAETENAELAAKVQDQAEFDAKVEAAASAKVASLGHPEPIEADGSQDNSTEMPRAEFNKMTPSEKSEFSKNGGRIK